MPSVMDWMIGTVLVKSIDYKGRTMDPEDIVQKINLGCITSFNRKYTIQFIIQTIPKACIKRLVRPAHPVGQLNKLLHIVLQRSSILLKNQQLLSDVPIHLLGGSVILSGVFRQMKTIGRYHKQTGIYFKRYRRTDQGRRTFRNKTSQITGTKTNNRQGKERTEELK